MFNQNRIDSQSYWQQLIPDLHITDQPLQSFDKTQMSASGLDDTQLRQFRGEGYFRTSPIIPPESSKRLAAAVQKISGLGLPPVYAFVYDEFWALLSSFDKLLTPLLDEGYRLKLIDPWIWQLNKNDKGFAPHRDLPAPHINRDGRPTLLNLWVALTDATPLNGCIYVLPTHLDPNYPDHLERIEIGINDAQNIRAVPAKAGSVLGWSPAILHWGAQSSQWAETPRISLGVSFVRKHSTPPATDFGLDYSQGPEISMDELTSLSFQTRLQYIGRMIWYLRTRVIKDYSDVSESLFDFCARHAASPAETNDIDYEARKMRSVTLWRKGRREEGMKLLQQVAEDRPDDAEVWIMLGRFHASFQAFDSSEACYRKALALNPNDALAHVCLGNALLQNTKHAPAEASYKEAIRLNPDIVDAYIGLSHAHHAQASLDDAMTAIGKALQLHPGHTAATEFQARLRQIAAN